MTKSLVGVPAIIESEYRPDIQQINAYEKRIVESEDDADDTLWRQAERVVKLLDSGMTQRSLAAQWINGRTGKPYAQGHVGFVLKAFEQFTVQPRPRFRDAYNQVANAKTVHVSHNSGENEWYTPSIYIQAAREVMGAIDLDPASSEAANRIVKASLYFTKETSGLDHNWAGRVWMNPPYSAELIGKFCAKMRASIENETVTQAITLVNNATETEWFEDLVNSGDAIVFPRSRIRFIDKSGNPSGAPLQGQAFVYSGTEISRFISIFSAFGWAATI